MFCVIRTEDEREKASHHLDKFTQRLWTKTLRKVLFGQRKGQHLEIEHVFSA